LWDWEVGLQKAYSYILVCPDPPNQRILGHVVVDIRTRMKLKWGRLFLSAR
jgi:hypothetical protein